MRYPPRQVSADAFHAGCDGSSPTRRRHLPHFRPQSLLCFGGGKDGDLVTCLPSRALKAEAQEFNLIGWPHATLLLVDLKPHARLQKSPNRSHDALSGAFAAHEDIAIIGVANKPETSPRQFVVQLVEHDIGKRRRKRAPLRRSFLNRDLRSVRHDHRRFQRQANQGDDPWVLHALGDPGQQALMMNSVKEFGQVEINHCLIAVLQISRCFGDGGMSAASGAEPVTAGMKGWLEDRLHDLEQRLLNHPIDDVRNA